MKFPVTLKSNRYLSLFLVIFLFILSGCSTTPEVEEDFSDPRDPFEPVNRAFWTFTWDYTDKYISKPVSVAYGDYVPTFLRSGLYNLALNLNEPSSIIDNLLQAKFSAAAENTGRFLLNSTVGLLGFFDPASNLGWNDSQEEFGEVLGSYGVGDGPFIVIPALDPPLYVKRWGILLMVYIGHWQ